MALSPFERGYGNHVHPLWSAPPTFATIVSGSKEHQRRSPENRIREGVSVKPLVIALSVVAAGPTEILRGASHDGKIVRKLF